MFPLSSKLYAYGYTVITGCIVYRGVAIPNALRLFLAKEAHDKRQGKYNLGPRKQHMGVVAELIESFEVPRSTKVVVLFASFSFHHRFSTLVKIGGVNILGRA